MILHLVFCDGTITRRGAGTLTLCRSRTLVRKFGKCSMYLAQGSGCRCTAHREENTLLQHLHNNVADDRCELELMLAFEMMPAPTEYNKGNNL